MVVTSRLNPPGCGSARLLAVGYWMLMAVIAFYAAELIPQVGTWSRAQAWRDAVPFLFVFGYLLAIVGAVWHVLFNHRLAWPLRLVLIAAFFVLPILGVAGYYWFVRDQRPVAPAELVDV